MHATADDGHAIKLARALVVCQQISKKFEDRPWVKIKGEQTWLKLMYLVLDSVENKGDGNQWIRSAGFEEAWKVGQMREAKLFIKLTFFSMFQIENSWHSKRTLVYDACRPSLIPSTHPPHHPDRGH
jgi:hypothetical protein